LKQHDGLAQEGTTGGCEGIDDFESWEVANISIGEYIEGFYNPCRPSFGAQLQQPDRIRADAFSEESW